MKALKASAVLLTLWASLNFLVAVGVTVMTLLGKTPVVAMAGVDDAGSPLRPIVYAQAAFANPCIVALTLLVLFIVWTRLVKGDTSAFVALVVALGPLQAFAFVSDAYLGRRNLVANIASAAFIVIGLSLADYGRRQVPRAARVA